MTEKDQAIPEPSSRPAEPAREQSSSASLLRGRRYGPTAILALAGLIGLVVWLVVESRGSSSKSATTKLEAFASSAELGKAAAKLGQPIYWVGNENNVQYELTRGSQGVYLRYLPRGVKAGDPRPFLTIATFPMVSAFDVTKKSSSAPDNVSFDPGKGGIAVFDKKHPTNVYVAYPGSNFQVDVYSPKAANARRLAATGRVQPLPGTASSGGQGPVAVSPRRLRALASTLGHPVYWVGPQPNTTYELTQTARGWTYVRYLPKGVPVGARETFLTIATYPMKNAFGVTSRAPRGPNTVTLRAPGGGIGVFARQYPRNVYVAYPGANAQVEVYSPSPAVPRRLVVSGRVVPVR